MDISLRDLTGWTITPTQFKERSVPLQTPSRFGKVGHHSRAGIIALFKTNDVCENVFSRFLNHVQMEEIENF